MESIVQLTLYSLANIHNVSLPPQRDVSLRGEAKDTR